MTGDSWRREEQGVSLGDTEDEATLKKSWQVTYHGIDTATCKPVVGIYIVLYWKSIILKNHLEKWSLEEDVPSVLTYWRGKYTGNIPF